MGSSTFLPLTVTCLSQMVSCHSLLKDIREETYRNLGHLKDVLGHMPLGQLARNRRPHPPHQPGLQPDPLPHQQEQKHALVQIPVPLLPDADALPHLGAKVLLHDGVDVGAAEPHAAGVQHAVRPAQHEDLAREGVHGAEVALRPGVLVPREVGGLVLGARGGRGAAVVPEVEGRVGEGGRGDEIAGRAGGQRRALAAFGEVVVVDGDGDAETAALGAANVDGRQGVVDDEAAGNVRTARDVADVHTLGKAHIIEPLKQLVRQHHARAHHRRQLAQVKLLLRHNPSLEQLPHPPRTDAQIRHPLLGRHPQQHLHIRHKRRPIVEDGPPTKREVAHAGEVHDPARGGVLQRHVVVVQVPVQAVLLVQVQQHGADAVDDGLGDPRRAGRVVDDGRLLKADALDRRRCGGGDLDEGLVPLRLGDAGC